MEKNFSVGQSNEILSEGRVIDLHNEYNFSGVAINPDWHLQVAFKPDEDYGRGQPLVTLVFEDVDYLEMKIELANEASCTVEELGYKSPNDRDDSWLAPERDSSALDHLFLRFSGEGFIRVHCKNACLR